MARLSYQTRIPVEDFKANSAARIVQLTFDVRGSRIVVILEYGNVVNSVFVPNKNVSDRVFILDGVHWSRVSTLLLNNEDSILNYLVQNGFESGTVR